MLVKGKGIIMLEQNSVLHDRYRILSLIGSGGTSNVYLAGDEHIGTHWAVKEIYCTNSIDYEPVAREIEMLKTIEHPMVPRIVDAWRDSSYFYIVSDYVEGITLAELIAREPLNRSTAVSVMRNVAKALMVLHDNDPPILYLDMKPSNIMVKSDGSIRLIDFGIATSGKSRFRYGTVGYAPPEQLGNSCDDSGAAESETDIRSDIFAFGMTYLVARTGYRPDGNIGAAKQFIKKEKRLSSKEKSFLYQCINALKKKRFASMRDVLENLNHIERTHVTVRYKITIPILISSVLCIAVYFAIGKYRNYVNQNTMLQMLSDSSKYLKDGEYTSDGIRVLAEYVDSGNLDKKTRDKYAYIVARAYLENLHDYETAKKYYQLLDTSEYPEAAYCIELCKLQSDFYDKSEDSVEGCLARYYSDVLTYTESGRKYDNLLTIAFCYEWYLTDMQEGRRLAAGVLNKGLEELAGERTGQLMGPELTEDYRERFETRIDDLKERMRISFAR